jgi:hypothetical protein
MGGALVPPRWATLGSGGGEAAEGAQANRALVQERDQAERARRWGWVVASARTWKTAEEQTLKPLVTPVPQTSAQRPRGPTEPPGRSRRTLWTSHPRLSWRHGGAVTVVRRKRGRNLGPQPTPLLGTKLARLTPSPVVCLDQKRWAGEWLHGARKSGLGRGAHQVSGDKDRSEQALGSAVLASLLVRRGCHHEMVPGKPWSLFQLQQA